ncbi:MAG: hypothetical protein JO297_16285 [Nitrososphaeraceae archaeon]|nr:hypothetical protein [Nitrososphaeraceae archaeon]
MASAVVAAKVLILSLLKRAKNTQFANNTDDNIMLTTVTVSTTVANNNSVPDIFIVSSVELRRLINM